MCEFPSVRTFLILVEVASGDNDVDVVIACVKRVNRDGVDLAFGDVSTNREIRSGDIVLHRLYVGTRGGELADEAIRRAG